MKKIKELLMVGGTLMLLGWAAGTALAQDPNGGPPGGGGFGGPGGGGGFGGPGGGGGFDPAQMQQMMEDMRQQMADAQRQQLEVTNDDEWKVISAQIQKVTDARAQANPAGAGGGMMGMFGGGRRGGRGGGFGGPGGGGPGGPGGGFPQMPGMPNVQPDPAMESLQKAVDANASSDELKAGITRLLESRKQKQETLVKAEADLRKLLSVRQEAIAYTMGIL